MLQLSGATALGLQIGMGDCQLDGVLGLRPARSTAPSTFGQSQERQNIMWDDLAKLGQEVSETRLIVTILARIIVCKQCDFDRYAYGNVQPMNPQAILCSYLCHCWVLSSVGFYSIREPSKDSEAIIRIVSDQATRFMSMSA